MSAPHIGIDIDNTIIDYDQVFGPVGEEIALLRAGHGLRSKAEVKSYLVGGSRGEEIWMRLQGQVYGRFIGRATMYEGVAEFLRMARQAGARISLISHKTRHGHFDADHVDLWAAAMAWLENHGFFEADGFGLERSDVHFRETRDAKVATIAQIGCSVFIDDLPEVLLHPDFPESVRKIWFAGSETGVGGLEAHRTWKEIASSVNRLVFADPHNLDGPPHP
jgi:hypothetical protein